MKPLWITYAHSDNETGNFDYLVNELNKVGIDIIFDKISLVPGQRLWEQIGKKICNGDLSGWAFLITANSLKSNACLEELEYALNRALNPNNTFPIIGLIHEVPSSEIPPAIKARLYVNLKNDTWKEEIKAGLEQRSLKLPKVNVLPYKTSITFNYLNQPGVTAFEISPRFGEVHYWRWAYPKAGPQPINWGTGPSGGKLVSSVSTDEISGETMSEEGLCIFIGSGNTLTPGTSAYLIFDKSFPQLMRFGQATGPTDIPELWFPLGFNTENPNFSKYIKK